MSYTVVISKSVQKHIDDLPNDVRERVLEKIQNLADEPRPDGSVKLKGYDNEYRIRVGDYRVRYEIDDETQLVQLWIIYFLVIPKTTANTASPTPSATAG
jgi:mRNA interferase RelE/StbE